MRRNEHFKLYSYEETEDEKTGKRRKVLRYIGPEYPVEVQAVRRRLPWIWAAVAGCAAAFVTAGFTPALGQVTSFVVAPYVLTLLPLFYAVMAAIRLTRVKAARIPEDVKREGFDSIRHSAVGLMVIPAVWLAAEAVLMVSRHLTGRDDWVFLACAGVCMGCGVVLWLHVRSLKPGKPIERKK